MKRHLFSGPLRKLQPPVQPAFLERMEPRCFYGSMSLVYGMPNHHANADFPGRQFGALGP